MAGPKAEALPLDLPNQLQAAVQKVDNPVAAVRAVRRVVARLPARYKGQRDAIRWEAELAVRPFFEADLRPFLGEDGAPLKAAKAAIWAALDEIWDGPNRGGLDKMDNGSPTRAPSPPTSIDEAARRVREAMRR